MKAYLFLAIAILTEIFGSSMLKASDGFSKLYPSIGVLIGYVSAFYFLSLALQSLSLSVSYAIWSGVGTALTAIVSVLIWKETISIQGGIGIVLIIVGVIMLNVGKSSV